MNTTRLLVLTMLLYNGCATLPPRNPDNLCSIFHEKDDWYQAAQRSYQRWGVPIPVQMAIMYQESAFVADAEPPRPNLLGFIPWFRSSSAYGYPQAQDETWDAYQRQAGNRFGDREDFVDSSDFIGWYCAVSHQKLGIAKTDPQKLYLAYHEGHGGFQRKSFLTKQWLMQTARKVAQRAQRYDRQLATCQKQLAEKN